MKQTDEIMSTPARGGMDLRWILDQATALQELSNRGVLPIVENSQTHKHEALALQLGKKMLGELCLFWLRGLDQNLRIMLQDEADFNRERAVAVAAAAQAPAPNPAPAPTEQK